MSYTEHYSTEVHYSGSVRCRYPASETGGWTSAHYDGYVPVDINVVVDTDPFDRSVRDANGALGIVAGALSAAEVAQVEQIRSSAKQISQTAIKGFYRTITSELSAQASEFGSSMKSTVGLLAEQAQQIEQVHAQMDSDYHAIKARYARLFSGLDRELDQRVHELDRSAFQLSERAMQDVITRPYEESAARVLVHSQDVSTTPLKLMCARAKACASHALKTLGQMCGYITDYSSAVQNVMSPKREKGYVYVPVVYAFQTDVANMQQRVVVHKPQFVDNDQVTRHVIAAVANSDQTQWQRPAPKDQDAIDGYFLQCLQEYTVGEPGQRGVAYHERVCNQIMSLYRQANTTTAYNG